MGILSNIDEYTLKRLCAENGAFVRLVTIILLSHLTNLNNMLTDVQRLNYLRAHLEGEAARAIAGFPVTSANYHQSLDLLRERFGDQQKIIDTHMQALSSLPHASNILTSFKAFHDATENHVCGLVALGQPTASYGAMVIPIVQGKLPVGIRRNMVREHSNLGWTLDQLREAIVKEIRALKVKLLEQLLGFP